jgi:hypothetical protein
MPNSIKANKQSRAFATRKYPVFGKGVYNEENPPKTVTSSPFYWWFKFLQLNEEYSKALQAKKTKIPKQFVEDMGKVTNIDFKSWWKVHSELFAEPITDYAMAIAKGDGDLAPFNSKEAINLVVPLNWTNVGIKRRFAQVIDKLVPKTKKGQAIQPSAAPYKLGRKWSITAFESAYNIYILKKQSDLAVLKGEKKVAWADIALKAKLPIAIRMQQGKHAYGRLESRSTLTILAVRHFERAEAFINAAVTNEFPKHTK